MEPTSQSKQFCTFYVAGGFFGIDVTRVQEVIRYQEMTHVPLATAVISGLINLRGQIVTAIEMRARLDLPPRTAEQPPMNVIVRTPEGPVSLLVDEIADVIEVDDATMDRLPDTVSAHTKHLVSGVHKLEGKLLLVLDADRAVAVGGVEIAPTTDMPS